MYNSGMDPLAGSDKFPLEYVWERIYLDAILETDNAKLPERIAVAESTLNRRIEQLRMENGGTPEEHTLPILSVLNINQSLQSR